MTKTPRYWRENTSRYNMIGAKCANCGKNYFPYRTMCPDCGRKSIGKMEEFKFSGAGKVFASTVVHEAHEQYEMMKPYILALIETDEGAKIRTDHRRGAGRDQDWDSRQIHLQKARRRGEGRHYILRIQVRKRVKLTIPYAAS